MPISSQRLRRSPMKQPRSPEKDVVSDSEEECIKPRRKLQLIVISSDESDGEVGDDDEKSESQSADGASVKEHPTSWLTAGGRNSELNPNSGDKYPRPATQMKTPQKSLGHLKQTTAQPRHMGVIELTDSSDDSEEEPMQPPTKPSNSAQDHSKKAGEFEEQTVISHGGFDDWLNDGSVMVLDEPRSARKPKRINPDDSTHTPKKTHGLDPFVLHIEGTVPHTPDANKRVPTTPLRSAPKLSLENTASQTRPRRAGGAKALAAAEQERRVAYAHELFVELNGTVFKGGLPVDTQLIWSKRLLTTAGRARWHRSRTGEETSSIELAEKILDCDERIRNTLSHEMCHLASWVIDKAPGENHGNIWKAWAHKVMKFYPEIEISTRHDYEIVYKYQWRCEKCTKIYGRHSKSIKSEEVVCGYCREGSLIPLFKTRPKAPSTPKTSRQASTQPRDSPQLKGLPKGLHNGRSIAHKDTHHHHADSDHEFDPILYLTKAMGTVRI